MRELLARIEASGILPPLVVLQVLAKNPAFRLSLVQDYVTRQLQADNRWAGRAGLPAAGWLRVCPACLGLVRLGRLAHACLLCVPGKRDSGVPHACMRPQAGRGRHALAGRAVGSRSVTQPCNVPVCVAGAFGLTRRRPSG